MSVYFFYGQEEYLLNKEIRKLKNELLDPSFISMAYKVFYNPPFKDLISCLQTPPLMFGNTLSIIHIDKYLTGAKISLDDKQIETIEESLKTLNGSVNIIFVCKIPREENKKPDSRKKLYKIISKYSQVREFAQFKTYQKELNTEISKIAKEKELSVTPDAISMITEQIGSDLTLIDSELEKLKVAIFPEKTIEKSDIKKYCTSSEDIFLLADLAVNGNKNEVMKQFNLLTEKRHPLEIISVLQSNIGRFIFIKSSEKKLTEQEIAAKLKLHEYVVKKTREKLRKTTLKDLISLRENLIDAEYKIKTGVIVDSTVLTETALLS